MLSIGMAWPDCCFHRITDMGVSVSWKWLRDRQTQALLQAGERSEGDSELESNGYIQRLHSVLQTLLIFSSN